MPGSRTPEGLLEPLELTDYEQQALAELLSLGRTTAPNLSEATGIPKARIYGVLEALGNRGFVKIIPGRPKEYQPMAPAAILDAAIEHRRQNFEAYVRDIESIREEFVETFQPLYEQASEDVTPTEELFYVVDVGEPSERTTRALYRDATDRINILTKSFEYLPAVEPTLTDALDREVEVNVLLLHPEHLSPSNRTIQRDIVDTLSDVYPAVRTRYSNEKLPWRGTIVDPSMDYERGKAILLVEEKDVPLHQRQAAVTENGSFVAGLNRYFDLVWAGDSVQEYPADDEF